MNKLVTVRVLSGLLLGVFLFTVGCGGGESGPASTPSTVKSNTEVTGVKGAPKKKLNVDTSSRRQHQKEQ